MRRVGVCTDSTCTLPPEVLREHDIRLVPIVIHHGGRNYRDGVDISAGEVYRIMRERKDLPSTSTPSAGDFLDVYRQMDHDAEGIVCITLSSLSSKTYEAAMVARGMAKEAMPDTQVEVIDSRAVAGVLGFIVLEAARAAERGASLQEVCDAARSMMKRAILIAMVDTLYYLARTGRVGRAAAWAGSLLNLKPVLEHNAEAGEPMPFARPRSKAKAIEVMLQALTDSVGTSRVHVNVHHADELEQGQRLRDEIGRRFDCAELYLTEFTPGMGVHAGPGIIGFSFYAER
ncbi:MAG: DegV family protein [Chloroflexi bacterium]|nr:DegV family protein [Chloroflexota bacterium]